MASFRVILKPSVHKDLRRLPQAVVRRVMARIEALGDDPLPRGSLKLSGSQHLHRLRVGDYRVIYGFDSSAGEVVVHHVRPRSDAYWDL
ncbi:MAG TPA: type II toxin-antitoxin system RelE/ParE family toxin [Planctomycetota bacterium]|nr:type II toxin-antitoxin system RelE/ParE family toxin [Planctomycetota bacterium]HRR81740.1 type II toxin-antitoxin system RelE/ParE family toxin [Planctomycetota bacterium]HRT95854.1 type II toxin-antitoxin system RelE/ParE family toxin [Planctomycetota bacterium]